MCPVRHMIDFVSSVGPPASEIEVTVPFMFHGCSRRLRSAARMRERKVVRTLREALFAKTIAGQLASPSQQQTRMAMRPLPFQAPFLSSQGPLGTPLLGFRECIPPQKIGLGSIVL